MKENLERIVRFLKNHKTIVWNVFFILYFFFGLLYIAGNSNNTTLDIFLFDIGCLVVYLIYLFVEGKNDK